MPVDSVTIEEGGIQRLTITEGGIDVVVSTEAIQVVTIGIQGPPGPQGEQGDPGPPGSGIYIEEDFPITDPVPTTVDLAHEPISGTLQVFLNGLKLLQSHFSVVAQTVTLPVEILDGDVVTCSYSYAP